MKSSIVGRLVDHAVPGVGAKLGMAFFALSAASAGQSAVPVQSAAAKMHSFAEIGE
jgi:hypothetical protein